MTEGAAVTTFVLIHGAWHGAWYWELLTPELQTRGHRVVAVDFPAEDTMAMFARKGSACCNRQLPTRRPPSPRSASRPAGSRRSARSPGHAELNRQFRQRLISQGLRAEPVPEQCRFLQLFEHGHGTGQRRVPGDGTQSHEGDAA